MTNQIDLKLLDGLSEEERKVALQILKEYADTGQSEFFEELKNADFDEVPVSVHEFLHDKQYLGAALYDPDGRFTLYPYWEKCLEDIFPDNLTTKYNNIVFTGAIGLGKSTIAIIAILYMLYRLLCLKDPYQYYGMQPIDKLSISLMNITLENAKGVALDKMNQMILSSQWFLRHGEMAGTSNLIFKPEKHIEIVLASSNNQIIGRAIFANFTDEVNFSLVNNPEKQKKKMMKLITQLDARMKSRFMRGTYLPTLNIIASSKDTEQSFLEEYIKNKEENNSTTTLIVDEPQWVVDSRKDTPEKFWVAVGNKFLANELPPRNTTDEEVEELRKKGYDMWQVPIGYLETFQLNLDEAICSIIGIATASSLKYIAGQRITDTQSDLYINPFVKDVIEVGDGKDDHLQYANFFDLSRVSEADKARPLFIHLDMSGGLSGKGGDKTGIAGVWITGREAMHNLALPSSTGDTAAALTDAEAQQLAISSDMHYRLAFSVSVKAPQGENLSYAKTRAFIRWLREQGFAIKGISSDTYQATQTHQDLRAEGFKTDIITVDKVQKDANGRPICLPYSFLKNAIYGRQLTLYNHCKQLTEELVSLERKGDGHIDHPQNGCFTGDTRVSLVDGRELTMLELIDEFNNGKINYVYSFNETKKIIEPKPIINAFKTFDDAKLLEVVLDSGEVITCTPNHKFMLRDGSYVEAQELVPGESLMPLYRKFPEEVVAMKDYRMYYEPIEDKWRYEHRRFANEMLDVKYLVHHKNCIKGDNTPTNLIWCSKLAHMLIHTALQTGAQSDEANAKRKASLIAYYADSKNMTALVARNKKISATLHNRAAGSEWTKQQNKRKQQHADIEKIYGVIWNELSKSEKNSYSVKYQRLLNPDTQAQISAKTSANHSAGKYINAATALANSNLESKRLKELIPTIDAEKFYNIFGFTLDSLPAAKRPPYIVKYRKIVGKTILNHKVASVITIDTTAAVYDLTIADNHNFALSSGIFVHNSKDQADAVCGALYLASKFSEEYSYSYGDNLDAALEANNDAQAENRKLQLISTFEAELSSIYAEINANEDAERQQKRQEYEYYSDLSNGIIVI